MPEFGCQAYWHELPIRIAPWKDDDEKRAVIAISKQIPGSVTPLRTRYFPPSSRRLYALRGRAALLDPVRIVRGIIADNNMTPLAALNVLLQDLGRPIAQVEEVRQIVDRVNSRVEESTQKSQGNTQHMFVESPTLQVLREVLEARDLVVTRLEARDVKSQGRCFHAADLQPHKLALMILDREHPLMAFAIAEPHHPKSRDRRQYLHLFVPQRFPHPWWRRARQVSRIDPNLTVCVYVHHKDIKMATPAAGKSEGEESDADTSTAASVRGGESVAAASIAARAPSHSRKRMDRRRRRSVASTVSCASADRSAVTVDGSIPQPSLTATSAELTDEEEEDQADSVMPRKLQRLEQARTVKFRNFSFPPTDVEDPFSHVATVTVQKFRTPKGVVHHWSQRLIERCKRDALYGHQTQDEDF
jgi:hypothetical protein